MIEKLKIVLWVGSGGFIGSVLRYLIASISSHKLFLSVSPGTLIVNTLGSFVIGLLFGIAEQKNLPGSFHYFLAVGVCGGFTTFSAFSVETFSFIRNEMFMQAILYVVICITLSLIATLFGFYIVRFF